MEIINPSGTQACPSCGHQNDEKAFFCSRCGAVIGSQAGRGRRSTLEGYRGEDDRPRSDMMPLFSLLITLFGFFLIGPFAPIIGVIMAHVSLHRMRQSGNYQNRGMAVAALVIGYACLILGLVLMILFGVFIGLSLFHEGVPSWRCF